MDLGTLLVHLKAEAAEFNKNLRESAEQVEHVAKRFKRASREIAMVGAEIGAVGAEAVHAAAKANPATNRALQDLKAAFESIAAEIGQAVLPIMRELTSTVRSIAEWFRGLDPHLKQNAVRFLAIVAAALLGIGVLGELSGVVAGLSGMFSIFSAVISSGLLVPLGVVVAVIASVIFWIIVFRKAWETNLGGVRDYVMSVKAELLGIWEDVKNGMSEGIAAIASSFTSIFDLAVGAVSRMLTFVLGAFDHVLSVAESAAKLVGKNLDLGGGHQAIAAATAAVSPNAIKSTMGDAGRWTKERASEAVQAVADGVRAAKDKAKAGGASVVGWIKDAMTEAGGDLKKFAKKLLTDMGLMGGQNAPLSREHMTVGFTEGSKATEKALEVANTKAFQDFYNDLLQQAHSVGAVAPATNEAVSLFQQERERKVSFTPAAQAAGRGMDMDLMGPIQKFASWLGDTWLSDAMSRLKSGALTLAQTVTTSFEVVGQGITNALLNSGGAFSNTVKAVMKGFAEGGVGGAIAAGATAMLSQSKQFQHIVSILNAIFQLLADTLGALLAPLEPLFGAVFNVVRALSMMLLPIFKLLAAVILPVVPIIQLLANVLQILAPIIAIVAQVFQMISTPIMLLAGPVMRALFDVLKFAANVIIAVVLAIAPLWNAIVGAIGSVLGALASIDINVGGLDLGHPFGFLQGAADAFNGMVIDTNALADSQKKLNKMTFDQAGAVAANTAAQLSNSAALDKATESLTNVPEGFKVAVERFKAIAPGMGPNIISGSTPGQDSQGNPIVPHFASGGRVYGPTLALIGEGGEPETVIPDSKMGAGDSGGGDINIQSVNVYTNDAQDLFSQLKALANRARYQRMGHFSRVGF